jgi:hypothetical protein
MRPRNGSVEPTTTAVTITRVNRRRGLFLSLPGLLAALLIAAGSAQAASAPTGLALNTAVGRSAPLESALVRPDPLRTGIAPRVATHAYDRIVVATGVAAEVAAPRFIVNGAGDVLDTSRVTIPEGKFGYLLKNPSKSGVFSDSMGFDRSSLDSSLRRHLVENFGDATPSEPMVGGGTKFSVTGSLTGPSGANWNITSVWGVDPNGLIRLITATP